MQKKIIEFKERIFNDPLAKGIVIIASGSVIAQAISIITMPVITRLYTPADFGVLGLFTSTLAILAIGGGLRYDSAFPLPKEDKDAANLFVFYLLVLSITTIILSFVIFLYKDNIVSYFHLESLGAYWILLIIGFFGVSFYSGLTSWITRFKEYRRITYTKIYQSAGGAVSKVFLGFMSLNTLGLLLGHLLSQILGVGTLMRYMRDKDRKVFQDISWSQMLANAKEYIRFPLFSFPQSIFNTLALNLPIFMVTAIYGLTVAGMFSVASSVLVMSSSLISASMGQVYFAEVSSLLRKDSNEIKNLYVATTKKLFLVGIPLFAVPSFLAPFLFPFVFGSVWKDAGYYCLPLTLYAFSHFVVSPTSSLNAYGYNHWSLIWDISRTVLLIISFALIQMLSLPIMSALFIISSVMAFMYGVSYLMNLRALDLYLKAHL